MKNLGWFICVVLVAGVAALGQAKSQEKKTAPAGTLTPARLCDDPFQVGDHAEGWPEAPVYILFHREKSKLPWSKNPAIHLPGIEAPTAAAARTLVCVEESQIEMGRYESGEAAYSPSWDVTLISLADRKVYFLKVGFYGGAPPGIKYTRGAGVGRRPIEAFNTWLPLVVNQKVARVRARFHPKTIDEVRALVFSGDGTRLAISQQPRSTLDGTPPSPVTVIDAASGKTVATWNVNYLQGDLGISRAGDLVALGHDGHPEIWDVATARMVRKLDISGNDSLVFGPNDALGIAERGNVTIWDLKSNRAISSGKGGRVAVSPSGEWLAIDAETKSVTVQAIASGRAVSSFPGVGAGTSVQYAVSGDAQSMARKDYGGADMVETGNTQELSVRLPNLGINDVSALAAGRDNFVFGNGDGIVGLASVKNPQVRAFATDQSAIRALAVSPDNKLIAAGDSSGQVTIWELR